MSQNRTTGGPEDVSGTGSGGSLGTAGRADAGASEYGTGRSTSTGLSTTGTAGAGEVAGAVSQVRERVSAVGEKLQDLRNLDYAEYANQAKEYTRQNPVQALLIAAAAGFVFGFLLRPPGDPTTPPPPPRKRR